jgi:tetratricopeptide (TPR) repeat protein
MKNLTIIIVIVTLLAACNNSKKDKSVVDTTQEATISYPGYEAISLLGDTLYAGEPSEKIIEKYNEKKVAYDANPNDIENIIWLGRFTAYLGNYSEAIDIYTKGMEQHPNDPRLYRHRGHRYITVRKFNKAVEDLEKAVTLIEGRENQVEPDGMPNEQNIPVSTLHGNIYYHLGLAHYLNRDMPEALAAYKKCLETSSNPDNVVSATHWIYMINRRMGREDSAKNYVKNIKKDMNVIENTAYHQACLFYKGDLELNDLKGKEGEDAASNSALNYAMANWLYYTGEKGKAEALLRQMVASDDWASFGHIAAESDLAKLY